MVCQQREKNSARNSFLPYPWTDMRITVVEELKTKTKNRMKTKGFVLSVFIFCIANFVTAQENKPTFLDKTHQNSISVELPFSISYSYAYKFNSSYTLGARVQGGFGLPITLLSTSVLYDDGYGD
jgi:hypothetical protein